MGFGASSLIHTAKILRLSEDLPILIECVDRAAKIEAVLPKLDAMIGEGLVTIERAEIRLVPRPRTPPPPRRDIMTPDNRGQQLRAPR